MKELNQPEVSEEDALQGQKTIAVETRAGKIVELVVRALPWRQSIRVSELTISHPALAVIEAVLHGVDWASEKARDEFLDTVITPHLTWIARVALELSNGVTEVKKRTAANSRGSTAQSSASPTV